MRIGSNVCVMVRGLLALYSSCKQCTHGTHLERVPQSKRSYTCLQIGYINWYQEQWSQLKASRALFHPPCSCVHVVLLAVLASWLHAAPVLSPDFCCNLCVRMLASVAAMLPSHAPGHAAKVRLLCTCRLYLLQLNEVALVLSRSILLMNV